MLNWEKFHFMVDDEIVLGHKVSAKGLQVDNAKIEVIKNFPPPTNIKGIWSFMGHARFYRCFIRKFSKISNPLCPLLEINTPFIFSIECHNTFMQLVQELISTPFLVVPNWNAPFELICDANDVAVGVVLQQRKNKILDPIYHASKTLNEA